MKDNFLLLVDDIYEIIHTKDGAMFMSAIIILAMLFKAAKIIPF